MSFNQPLKFLYSFVMGNVHCPDCQKITTNPYKINKIDNSNNKNVDRSLGSGKRYGRKTKMVSQIR